MARFEAVEVTAHQAFFLADYLGAGTYPWKLAITGAYVDPADREPFNARCIEELTIAGVIDSDGRVKHSAAESVRAVCKARQWLEWYTVVDADQMLRGVLARACPPDAVVALRYAQMVTFTPLQLIHSEAIVPIISAGLPQDQPPARFEEFELPMDLGRQIDERVARGADIAETLTDLGVPAHAAEVMEMARTGKRITVELTAHDAGDNGRQQTDVSVNLISSEVGLILVSPPPGEPREGGVSIFAPGDPFAISMAVRNLTDRLPSGTWFPDENYDI